MNNVTNIPTKLMSDTTAKAIINKARVIDTKVEQDIEADKPVKSVAVYWQQAVAIIAGVSDGQDHN